MFASLNLDLLTVGIAAAGIGILGFTVYFNNQKSATNKIFLAFSITAILWSVTNYIAYQSRDPQLVLNFFRLELFFATWYSFFLYEFLFTFPRQEREFSKSHKFVLRPLAILTSLTTLTPIVFSGIKEISQTTQVPVLQVQPGIAVFGIVVLGFIGGGIFNLIRKTIKAEGVEKKQFRYILLGITLTFILHLAFNFILPAFFDNTRFIPFGAVFTFPFVAFTTYAIVRHHLLNVKVVATEIVTFLLLVSTFSEVIISKGITELVFRSAIFIVLLGFGILLIRSVQLEVEQREQLQELNVKLQDANKQLEELSAFKTQLLSLASHQVKAPLAIIKQFATIIIEGLYGPVNDKVKETLGKMKRASDELIGLVNSLLDLRKVEEGKMEYTFAPANLKTMIKEVMELDQALAIEKKLELTFEGDSEGMVNADVPKLKQVIQNFIDNAVKYTPQGFVKVKLSEDTSAGPGIGAGFMVMSVSDSGLGMSKELIPHLFDEFVRDKRVKDLIRGTGLGLFIAKKIVEAHGGQVWAESDGEGKGSTFFMRVPKVK